jgi:predicted RNase H-like HicB family nuclease
MRFFSFEIVIEREAEDEGYSAYSPTLPGCFSNGKTIEEAKRHIREAIQQHVESLLARGQPVLQNERFVHVEELTVGIYSGLIATLRNLITPAPCCSVNGPSANRPFR